MDQKRLFFELMYSNKKLTEIDYTQSSTVAHVIEGISKLFRVNESEVKLTYNKKLINEEQNSLISNFLITQLSQIPNSKLKVQVIPQISIENIPFKQNFYQVGNEENCFQFSTEYFSKFGETRQKTLDFFQKIFSEFNQHLSEICYYKNFEDEAEDPAFNPEHFTYEVFPLTSEKNFDFLVKNEAICFYPRIQEKRQLILEEKKEVERVPNVGMFKVPRKDEVYKIIVQTYNKVIKEIEVSNSMTIGELKDMIQQTFYVSKQYQDLSFLFYKLDDDSALVSDYKMKKNSTIYLRGFYFPVLFCDYFTKQKSNIHINIASNIREIVQLIINKFKLDCDPDAIQLVCNGKMLDSEKYLIEYNIQKHQTIYFK